MNDERRREKGGIKEGMMPKVIDLNRNGMCPLPQQGNKSFKQMKNKKSNKFAINSKSKFE